MGHQAMFKFLTEHAKNLGIPTALMCFEPMPGEKLLEVKHIRLSNLRDKIIKIFERSEIEYVFIQRFHESFARISAEDFVRKTLIEGLNVKLLVIGKDFRFGFQRGGDESYLKTFSEFKTVSLNDIPFEGIDRVSSSKIRELLVRGDIGRVNELLDSTFTLTGRVMHGLKLGRKLGFPTANIQLSRNALHFRGIFVVRAIIQGYERIFNAVASLGVNPTINDDGILKLEVHILDFDEDIYGYRVSVEFLSRIRDEMHFDSLESLVERIKLDCEFARGYFASCL